MLSAKSKFSSLWICKIFFSLILFANKWCGTIRLALYITPLQSEHGNPMQYSRNLYMKPSILACDIKKPILFLCIQQCLLDIPHKVIPRNQNIKHGQTERTWKPCTRTKAVCRGMIIQGFHFSFFRLFRYFSGRSIDAYPKVYLSVIRLLFLSNLKSFSVIIFMLKETLYLDGQSLFPSWETLKSTLHLLQCALYLLLLHLDKTSHSCIFVSVFLYWCRCGHFLCA